MLHYTRNIGVVLFICLVLGTAAWGGSIKERMLQRQPVIVDLKAQGVVGETNNGYLGYVTAQQPSPDVIAAENQDRKTIYTKIAEQQQISVSLVEKRRAQVLAERALAGEYIQNEAGAWIKK